MNLLFKLILLSLYFQTDDNREQREEAQRKTDRKGYFAAQFKKQKTHVKNPSKNGHSQQVSQYVQVTAQCCYTFMYSVVGMNTAVTALVDLCCKKATFVQKSKK